MQRFALVDCNNFFVSCERIFDPTLLGKPVVVLSSNDACVIARSNEAKQLGIKMGAPAFMTQDVFEKHGVKVYSSNFALYSDISSRVMTTLSNYATDIELYSIDEAFLHFPEPATSLEALQEHAYYRNYAAYVRKSVKKQVGIPVSIGLGPTKTLAKIANHIAKKNPEYNGVFDITNHPEINELLKAFPVGDIWGIGYRYAKLLANHGITNALQLAQCNDGWIRKNLTINGLKTVQELRGTVCLSLQENHDTKKSLTVSRSFGKNVTELAELQEAVAFHVTAVAEKLRKQGMVAGTVTVFVRCAYPNDYVYRFYKSEFSPCALPTAYTPTLITQALACLQKLYSREIVYKKVGILVTDLYAADSVQLNALLPAPDLARQMRFMKAIDRINTKMGKNKVFFARVGIKHAWKSKCAQKSPAYTTNWNELLRVKI